MGDRQYELPSLEETNNQPKFSGDSIPTVIQIKSASFVTLQRKTGVTVSDGRSLSFARVECPLHVSLIPVYLYCLRFDDNMINKH